MEVWAACRWPWGLGAAAVLCPPCQALRGTEVPKSWRHLPDELQAMEGELQPPIRCMCWAVWVTVGWAALSQDDVGTSLIVTSSLLPKVDAYCRVWAGAWQWVSCVFSRSW